jgi:hypothetical protein
MWSQYVRCDQRIGQIDRRIRRQWTNQEFDQADRARIAPKQIPMSIDGNARKRFLLSQHVIECGTNLTQLRRGEVGLPPYRRKAGCHQQGVVLAQRYVEGGRKPHHHLAAGRRAA